VVIAADLYGRYSQFSRPEPLLFFKVASHLTYSFISAISIETPHFLECLSCSLFHGFELN
jgi:hypothetical protein